MLARVGQTGEILARVHAAHVQDEPLRQRVPATHGVDRLAVRWRAVGRRRQRDDRGCTPESGLDALGREPRIGNHGVGPAERVSQLRALADHAPARERPGHVEHGHVVERDDRRHADARRQGGIEPVNEIELAGHAKPREGATDSRDHGVNSGCHARGQVTDGVRLHLRQQVGRGAACELAQQLADVGLDTTAARTQRQRVQRDSGTHVATTARSSQK